MSRDKEIVVCVAIAFAGGLAIGGLLISPCEEQPLPCHGDPDYVETMLDSMAKTQSVLKRKVRALEDSMDELKPAEGE